MKIYTKTGDDGTTGLLGSSRVRKDHPRIEACGALDEVNAAIGVVLSVLPPDVTSRSWLEAIQSDLFVIGAALAMPQEGAPRATLEASRVAALESQIDQMEKDLKPLKQFILPQGVPAGAWLHLARALSRGAERRVVALAGGAPVAPVVVAYLNRLSDFLFVLARWVNHREGAEETLWNHPLSGEDGPKPDKLSASLQKLQDEKKRRESLFERTALDLQKKKEDAAKSFQKNVDQIHREGGKVEPDIRPIDLD